MSDTFKIKPNKGVDSNTSVSFSHKANKTPSVYTGSNPGVFSPRRGLSKGERLSKALGLTIKTGVEVARQVNKETYQENLKDWRVEADNVNLKYNAELSKTLKNLDYVNMSEDEIEQVVEESKKSLKEEYFSSLNDEQKRMINTNVLKTDLLANESVLDGFYKKGRNDKLVKAGENISMVINNVKDPKEARNLISNYYDNNIKKDGFNISRNEYAKQVVQVFTNKIQENLNTNNFTEAKHFLDVLKTKDGNGISWIKNPSLNSKIIRLETAIDNAEDKWETQGRKKVQQNNALNAYEELYKILESGDDVDKQEFINFLQKNKNNFSDKDYLSLLNKANKIDFDKIEDTKAREGFLEDYANGNVTLENFDEEYEDSLNPKDYLKYKKELIRVEQHKLTPFIKAYKVKLQQAISPESVFKYTAYQFGIPLSEPSKFKFLKASAELDNWVNSELDKGIVPTEEDIQNKTLDLSEKYKSNKTITDIQKQVNDELDKRHKDEENNSSIFDKAIHSIQNIFNTATDN